MKPTAIEQRVREYVAGERDRIPVPTFLPQQILRAVEARKPVPYRSRLRFLRVAAAMAAMLLLGVGIASIRVSSSPAGVVQGSWSSTAPMQVERGSHTATRLPNGKVLVVGGSQTVRAVASSELFDPRTGTWSDAGSLSQPRWGHTATLLRTGKVLVAGGNQAGGDQLDPLSSVELYDPQTNRWSPAASMHTPRAFHSATLLDDGRVLVTGGNDYWGDAGGTLATSELYDPVSNIWTRGPIMKTPRARQTAVLLADGRILVIGGTAGFGVGEASSAWRSAELYDPATNSWSSAGNMQYARAMASANLLPDDRVLVVGDEGINYRTAELYDPTTGSWSSAPNPGFGRAEAATAQLRDGNVLVAGGLGETSTQVFDWRVNRWVSAGDLATFRAGASATLLADGRVLVAGGFGGLAAPWASTELYDPNGRHVAAASRGITTTLPLTGIGPILGSAALLLGLGIWTMYQRKRLRSVSRDAWLDAD